LHSKGKYDEAVEYHTRALDIRIEKLGPRHPEVTESLNNIGSALHSKGKYDQAVEYHTRALDIRLQTLGVHPYTLLSLSNLSSSFIRCGQPEFAAECSLCSLRMLVSKPSLAHSLKQKLKSRGCDVHMLVQEQLFSEALPLLPSLDCAAAELEGTSAAEGGAWVCLYLCAAAQVYRQCDMPSRAAAATRRAAAAIRRLGVPLASTPSAAEFKSAGLSMDAAELDKCARQLDRLSASRRDPEPDVPRIADGAPAAPRLRLPVRARAFLCCARCTMRRLTLLFVFCSCAKQTCCPRPSPRCLRPQNGSCRVSA